MYDELIKRLRGVAEEVANDYDVDPYNAEQRCFVIEQAAYAIEVLQDALLLMVLQYCTTDAGLLYHSFMSAGENAFAVLGLKNGQQADPLWDRVLIQKLPKEE